MEEGEAVSTSENYPANKCPALLISQLTFTCSKSTIAILENGVEYVQS